MRRHLFELGVFQLLGAIVNLAVAWAYTLRADYDWLMYGANGKETYPVVDRYGLWRPHWPRQSILQYEASATGISYVQVENGICGPGNIGVVMWCAGLPMRSMEGRSVHENIENHLEDAIAFHLPNSSV